MTTQQQQVATAPRAGEPGTAADPRGEGYKWTALSNTTIGVLLATIDASIMLIAMPDIFRGIGLNPLAPGNSFYLLWMILGFLVVSSVLVVSLGRLGDMYGRVRMYNLGFVIYTLASLLLTIDPMHGKSGALWLIVGRILQGIGAAFLIANSGAIEPLVALLNSEDGKTQENAVTALLNLSINDNNKAEIARAGAIGPLVNVLRVGNAEAMENAAATLFSLSVMDDNKVTIGASGAIPPLVDLLINGSPRGKKDAATALFNLSIYHENKGRIVHAGAIRPLVELMADPAAGMADKAVAVLANLATIPEGRQAIGEDQGIPALVEVVEAGSQRGKENAAAALLQLCTNSHRHRALVLQEGAIPPLVALSQSGTPRAKEKVKTPPLPPHFFFLVVLGMIFPFMKVIV